MILVCYPFFGLMGQLQHQDFRKHQDFRRTKDSRSHVLLPSALYSQGQETLLSAIRVRVRTGRAHMSVKYHVVVHA